MQHHKTIVIEGTDVFGTALTERLVCNNTNVVILQALEEDVVQPESSGKL